MMRARRESVWLLSALLIGACLLARHAAAVEDEPAAAAKSANARDVSERVISGQVVDEQGQPVAGAHLWWVVGHDRPGAIVEGESDEKGRFSMATSEMPVQARGFVSHTVWVLKAGKQLTTFNARRKAAERAGSTELVVRLQPESDTSFVVKSPDGVPVSGARVEPWMFHTDAGYEGLPTDVVNRIAGITDENGRVAMPSMSREDLYSVRVIANAFGSQQLQLRGDRQPAAERTIELRPTGRIEGQLLADDPQWLRGIELVFTTADPNPYVRKSEGQATVTPDGQGRFVVPVIAEGRLNVQVRVPDDPAAIPRLPKPEMIVAGKTKTLSINLERSVVVRGVIKTDDTDAPVEGAEIAVGYGVGRQADFVISGAEGRFEAQVLPGPVDTQVIVRPKEFSDYIQFGDSRDAAVTVPAASSPFDLPPILLTPTVRLEGKLVDQNGKPVADAAFYGVQGNRRYGMARTTEAGEFVIRVPKSVTLDRYEARFPAQRGMQATVVKNDPLVLRVTTPAQESPPADQK